MKNIRSLGVLIMVFALAGCSSTGFKPLDWIPAAFKPQPAAQPVSAEKTKKAAPPGEITVNDGNGEVVVQTVEFRSGTSSATVERLAKRFGCNGSAGAGLVTEKGPVEVYRMKCDNGTTFMAQCELRQCRPMR